MYKVLVDSNIIIDFLYMRKPFYSDSKKIIQLVEDKVVRGCVTTSILMDLHYIICHRFSTKNEANKSCEAIIQIFDILNVEDNDIVDALIKNPVDFEDTVVEMCAKRNKCDYIITRNIKHFDKTIAIEPWVFIDMIKNGGSD